MSDETVVVILEHESVVEVLESEDEIVVERQTAEAGVVFNHFPQAGFEIQSV